MGDFDKNQVPAPSSDKRKQILVGVLGCVLLGIVGFHFMKGNPTPVSADILPGVSDPNGEFLKESPRDAIAKLERDPTAIHLMSTPKLDPTLLDVPQNPFRLSDRWLAALKKPEIIKPTQTIDPQPHIPQTVHSAPAIATNGLKVDGIFRMGKNLQAIINGSLVSSGMSVGDVFIVEIQEDRVVVRHKDYADGPTTTLMIQSKIK